jgi:hypothetical protein
MRGYEPLRKSNDLSANSTCLRNQAASFCDAGFTVQVHRRRLHSSQFDAR